MHYDIIFRASNPLQSTLRLPIVFILHVVDNICEGLQALQSPSKKLGAPLGFELLQLKVFFGKRVFR